MSSYAKQVADVYFNEEDGTYRAVVEFYPEDHGSDPVVVPVIFRGDTSLSFDRIRDAAFKAASDIVACLS